MSTTTSRYHDRPATPASATWTERVELTLRDLEAAALITNIAGLRFAVAAYQSDPDLPSRRRALQTALDRLEHALRRARATPALPHVDVERHMRAGIARWTDAAGALTTGLQRTDHAELRRGERAGDAGNWEFGRAHRALAEPLGPHPDSSSKGLS
jgi:hypothetical protein